MQWMQNTADGCHPLDQADGLAIGPPVDNYETASTVVKCIVIILPGNIKKVRRNYSTTKVHLMLSYLILQNETLF